MTARTAGAAQIATTAVGMVNGPEGDSTDWLSIHWRQVEDDVRRLRQRIFTASRAGDLAKVRNLQKLMLRSRANTLHSVRRVTELNAGRATAGIDGKVVLHPQDKADVADWMQHQAAPWRPKPVKRVYIAQGERETARPRNPRDHRQVPSGSDVGRAGTRVGSPTRAESLRLSPGSGLS